MAFNGYHHIGLSCTDTERSLAFYKALGGVETGSFPLGNSGKMAYFVDMGGGAVVELLPTMATPAPEESSARWVHICLLAENTRASYDMAVKNGAKPKTSPQDIMLGEMSVCNCFVLGPDDESIEFFELT